MSTAPIRTAVVGLGWAGRQIWLPRLVEHPAYEVVAAVDSEPVVRATAARTAPGARLLASTEDLDPTEVDLAVVAVPNHLHAPVAARLLERGIAVFLEKPVCLSAAEAGTLAVAERAGDTVLLAGSAARYRADVRALHELAPTLGGLRHVEASWVRAGGVPAQGGWFTRRDLAGGGALIDLGWHLFDTVLPLLDGAPVEHALATVSYDFINDRTRQAVWRRDGGGHPVEGNVEDTARCFLVSSTGVSMALRTCWASHEPVDTTVLRVEGSDGTAELRCTFGFSPNRVRTPRLEVVRDGRVDIVDLPAEEVGGEYLRQLDVLPSELADPSAPGRALRHARPTISVIERCYDSARSVDSALRWTGRPVNAHAKGTRW